jgi:hypothetical protein
LREVARSPYVGGVMLRTAGVLFALFAAAAWAGGIQVIPWKPERRPVSPPPRLAPQCRVASLKVSEGFQGATGNLAGAVVLRNIGARPCSLAARARLVLPTGKQRLVTKQTGPPLGDDPFNRPPLSQLRALPAGSRAGFSVFWGNWCGPRARALTVVLPGTGVLRVPLPGAPRCDAPTFPSTLSVSRLAPAVVPPRLTLPLQVKFLGAVRKKGKTSIVVYRARPGQVLRYELALVNVSARPFAFLTCPVYAQGLDGARVGFVLNCRPVGTLASRGRALFAMRLRLPAHLHAGVHDLIWSLPQARNGPWAPALVQIP